MSNSVNHIEPKLCSTANTFLYELLLFPIDGLNTVYAGVKLALFTVKEEVLLMQTGLVTLVAKDAVLFLIVNWRDAFRNLEKMLFFAFGAA